MNTTYSQGIVYSINREDIQNVAQDHLGRSISRKEMKLVEDKIGDYIDWNEAIISALNASKIK